MILTFFSLSSFFFIFFLTLIIGPVLSYKHPCTPKQIHLVLSDTYTSNPKINSPIKLIFHTVEECPNAYITLTTPKGLQQNISASAVNLFQADYERGPYATHVHIFDFPQLEFEQIYQYSCFPGDRYFPGIPQGPFEFYLPSPNYKKNQTTKVVMFADMDTSIDGLTTVNRLGEISETNFTDISAYIHVGDMCYDLERVAGRRGGRYMQTIQQFAAFIPYMVTAGNHETMANFSNFNMRFKMPNFQNSQNHYYSYNIGNMHFISFNLDFVLLSPKYEKSMLNWLENDLIKANETRENQPWIIVYTHRPLYCSYKDGSCPTGSKRFSKFEDLFIKYNVDLVVSGHVHFYERMLPIKKGKIAPFQINLGDDNFNEIINPQSPVYVLQGMAGQSGDKADKQYLYKGKEWTVKVSKDYSYLSVSSNNNTHLLIEDFL